MKEKTYNVTVEIEGKEHAVVYNNVLYDGMQQDKPYFYVFRFADRTQIEYPIGRILCLEYGSDKADYIEYWKGQEKKDLKD